MKRREFIVGAGSWVWFVPASGVLVACEGKSAPSDLTFTSSVVQGHSHEATLARGDVESPPAAGAQKTTTSAGGHTHVVVLSAEELRAIDGGGSVTKTTSTQAAHAHAFTFARSAANSTAPELPSGY